MKFRFRKDSILKALFLYINYLLMSMYAKEDTLNLPQFNGHFNEQRDIL